MNYKIKVNNEAESKEVQELFFGLGYKWFSGGNQVQHLKQSCSSSFGYLVAWSSGCFTDVIQCGCGNEDAKEITLPQLRDLVVLKRNSIDDATHGNESAQRGYLASDGVEYIYDFYDKKWRRFPTLTFSSSKLKLIEKPMKEYLNKETHEFVRSHSELNDMWMEIPEDAEEYLWFNDEFDGCEFYKNGRKEYFCGKRWRVHNRKTYPESMRILWRRHQEETTSDKVASAEIARQESKECGLEGCAPYKPKEFKIEINAEWIGEEKEKHSHYKKYVKNLDYVDVYRVLDLFEVKSHAVGHAVKKLLCSGQRGAKDEIQDIQEAIDSLNRHIEMIKEDDFEL